MKLKIITVILFSSLIQGFAQAKVNDRLQKYFEQEIQNITQAVTKTEVKTSGLYGEDQSKDMWFLNRFRLFFRVSAGFEVDGFAQFMVQPEVEMLFMRYPAPGWAPYRPK